MKKCYLGPILLNKDIGFNSPLNNLKQNTLSLMSHNSLILYCAFCFNQFVVISATITNYYIPLYFKVANCILCKVCGY